MRLRIRFGDREFELEDGTPFNEAGLYSLVSLARTALLAPGQVKLVDEDEEGEDVTLESNTSLGFRGSVDNDDEDDDG